MLLGFFYSRVQENPIIYFQELNHTVIETCPIYLERIEQTLQRVKK